MADHCGPVSIVNKNTSCLSQLPTRLREYKANDSEMSWRLQRRGVKTPILLITPASHRGNLKYSNHTIFF